MATGTQIALISLKCTSMNFMPGTGNSVLVQVNLEGPSDKYGVVARSATFANAGAKHGTFTAAGAGYLENGDAVTGTGQGTFESIGVHKWKTKELFTFADGSTAYLESVLDFAERSWIMKVYDHA